MKSEKRESQIRVELIEEAAKQLKGAIEEYHNYAQTLSRDDSTYSQKKYRIERYCSDIELQITKIRKEYGY